MAVIEDATTNAKQRVDSKHLASRVSQRPMELGARGAYVIGLTTGVLPAALAANSEIFQFRWSHSVLFAILRAVRVSASVSTTAFVAGVPPQIEMRIARGWTVQGTGGTGITFGTDDAKKRSSFAQTAMANGDVRIATTAALGAGTKTLDGVAVANIVGNTAAATGTTQIIPPGTILWARDTGEEFPFVFAQNEGFVIRSVAVPGTGTWQFSVIVEWSEIDPSVDSSWA
jgi:hypothetical protein